MYANEVHQQQEETLQRIELILEKFQKKRFESLSLEDLAIAVSTKNFPQLFKKVTGEDWVKNYQIKANERLSHAKFDVKWNTRKSHDMARPLFTNTEKGDLKKVQDFFKLFGKGSENTNQILQSVDTAQRSPLHIAVIQGHLKICQFLLEQGFQVNARDRTLKTPFLYACLHGRVEIAQLLVKNGARHDAVESGGKSCMHMAAQSDSPQTVAYLLSLNPDLISQVDNAQLTPLHYSVWNVSEKQLDIMRIFIEKGCEIDARDEDGCTALLHASKKGRMKAVKILAANGANPQIIDKKSLRNCLEVAANEQIRQTIVIYCSKQTFQIENFNECGLVPFGTDAFSLKSDNKCERNEAVEVIEAPKINPYNEINTTPVSQFFRGRFYSMLKKLQEDGVKQWQHVRSPGAFTASWMEEINTLDDLFDFTKNISPQEALMKTFNLLCPYEYHLPVPELKNQFELDEEFYGKKW